MNAGRRGWPLAWLVIAVICLALAYFAGRHQQDADETRRYRTAPVTRGEVFQTVSANGTLNPVVLVNVGTQISGRIQHLHADFNDQVKEGQVLAELDPRLIEAQLRQSRANVATAQADLRLAESNAERTRAMVQRKFLAEAELDTAVKTVDVARAALERARAQVAYEETNRLYTVIRSPVSGIVISRNVDIGQTVAATFQTPILFQIAQDLTRMQIDTSLAEADVGGVRVGQHVTFTVDAYPDRTFKGLVRQIRMNPSIQQNVVTYDVVVTVDNAERLLLPGMTAVVTIRIGERKDVLRLPLAALRFHPSAVPEKLPEGLAADQRIVFRLEDGKAVPVGVRIGIFGSREAELVKGELHENDPLVIEETSAAQKGAASGGKPPTRMF